VDNPADAPVDGPDGRSRSAGRLARVPTSPRFLQLADVAEVLNISAAQVYALVRSGDLPAIKIGGRGQWRVETSELEGYIARMYEQTRDFVSTHPLGRTDDEDDPADGDGEPADDVGPPEDAVTDSRDS
jgi:excisionase family DNA binding protein